jgi:arginine N-succinyltransferase
MVVRPVRAGDLDAVVDLVERAGYGLTSLPKDRDLLGKRVRASVESMVRPVEGPGSESYLFVLEDRETGRVVGTSGIVAKVGGFEPFYTYRIDAHVHQSEALQVRKLVSCLHLVAEHSGPSEIGSLFLSSEYRRHGAGRLLSLARFLFMAEQTQRFEREVIAEMRGVVDPEGRCPFWEAIGRHFFDIDFPKADYLSSKDKRFIAELMPTHPIYIPLLAAEAQQALGQVHPETEPALRMLEGEGFRWQHMVDIFDGGPLIGCPRGEIRTVQGSRLGRLAECRREVEGELFLLARSEPEFAVTVTNLQEDASGAVVVEDTAAEALGLRRGARVRYVPSRPRRGAP